MRILKPQHLSVLHRCFEREGKAYLSVSVLAFLPLNAAPALLPEQELWQVVPPLLDPMTPLDSGVTRLGGEFLVVGDACAPEGKPVQGLEVSATVGSLRKTLHVLGPRYWDGRRPSVPQTFTRLPTGWSHAFGGPSFAENPLGMGIELADTPSGRIQPMPCVESPQFPCTHAGDFVSPVSFAPIPPTWPQRKLFDGTYDDTWLKEVFPGPPKDFNWRFHCMAPKDQWQAQPFIGTESIELGHLHPDVPLIQHALPGIKAVVAIRRKGMSSPTAQILDTRLSTLWLFPNQLRMVMIWQALVQVDDEFADQVELLMAAAEWLERPKDPHSYVEAINARLDEENGALKLLDDHELLPEGLATPNEMMERFQKTLGTNPVAVEDLMARLHASQTELDARMTKEFGAEAVAHSKTALAQRKQEMGIPDLPKSLPDTPQGLAAFAQQFFKSTPKAETLKAHLDNSVAEGIHAMRQDYLNAGFDADNVDAIFNAPRSKSLRISPQGQIAAMEQHLNDMPKIEGVPISMDPKIKSMIAESEHSVTRMQRGIAHLQDPPAPLDATTAGRWREGAAKAHATGQSFAGLKLQAADFSDMDLSGVDFSGAELDGASFVRANLSGSDFTNASLAHAVLDDAMIDGANFTGANLGHANFIHASCANANFQEATLHYTVLDGSRLAGSNFAEVTFNEIQASRADWTGVDLTQATLIKCRLPGSIFVNAKLTKATLLETNLSGSDFSSANLSATDFVTCQLDDSIFDNCQAANVRFVYHSSLRRISFQQAQVPNANFRGMPLDAANFSGANLDGSDLSEVLCAHGNFRKASLKGALLIKGHFEQATFTGCNLMNAILQYAWLKGANFNNTNLYGADLMRVDADTDTRFDDAFTAKARLLPQRRVQPVNMDPAQ